MHDPTQRCKRIMAAVLACGFIARPAFADPDLRIFVVDAVMLAGMDAAMRNQTETHIREDIAQLAEDPAYAPDLAAYLMVQNGRSTQVFGYTQLPKGTRVDGAVRDGIQKGIERAIAGQATGRLDLPALRGRLLDVLGDSGVLQSGGSVDLHVFADEWRTAVDAVHTISSADGAGATTSKRPSQCFVRDLGEHTLVNAPWPANIELRVELRPPEQRAAPSELALGTLIAVLSGGINLPYAYSLGIAGPRCPPGRHLAPAFLPLDDPANCDRPEPPDGPTTDRKPPCVPDSPLLAASDPGLVRRPLNLVAVDGDGVATGLAITAQSGPAASRASWHLGPVAVQPGGAPDLGQILAHGSGAPLRLLVQGAGNCSMAQPLQAEVALMGSSQTSVHLVTAPVACDALASPMGLSFDLLTVTVN